MDESNAGIIAQYLDLQSLGRFSQTCKLFRSIVDDNVLAWHAVYESLAGNGSPPNEWECLSWKDRVKRLVSVEKPFRENKHDVVFSYGPWRFLTIVPNTTYIFTTDFLTVVELHHPSNGWWRLRIDGTEYVVWPLFPVSRSLQKLDSANLESFRPRFNDADSVPLFSGARCVLPTPGNYHTAVRIVGEDIVVEFPHSQAKILTLKKDVVSSTWHDQILSKLRVN